MIDQDWGRTLGAMFWYMLLWAAVAWLPRLLRGLVRLWHDRRMDTEAALRAATEHMLKALEHITGCLSKEEARIVAQEALEVVRPVRKLLAESAPKLMA